jgi:hybrid cluster-associated redox disulfide protein
MKKAIAKAKVTKKKAAKKPAAKKEKGMKITGGMTLGDVVSKYPETAMVMYKYGLHCIGCHVATWETIEQGCRAHGISDKDIDKMIEEMNASISK